MDVATAAAVQAIAAVVSLGLTGALVAITAYYAKQTRRTVEEMERGRSVTERTIDEMRKGREATDRTVAEMGAARELALMPTLTCRLDVDHERAARASNDMGAGTLDVAADYTALVLANAGNAPALDVALHIDGEPRDRGRLRAYRADGERVGIIGVGADWPASPTVRQGLLSRPGPLGGPARPARSGRRRPRDLCERLWPPLPDVRDVRSRRGRGGDRLGPARQLGRVAG